MSEAIEFYFDFSSPYGYFASHKIDELAGRFGRQVKWKPVMIGAAFKKTGTEPLIKQPMKGEYSERDWRRLGRYMEVPWTLPDPFPISALAASRAFYWIEDRDTEQARRFAKSAYGAYFGEGRDISVPQTVADIAAALDVGRDQLLAALERPAVKARLKKETGEAIDRGVFGSPFIFVDGEPFWGSDRLWMVKKWLERGGW